MNTKDEQGFRVTDTTRFLLRGLSLYKKDLEGYGFLNAYLDDADHEHHYENSVYLLFKPRDLGIFEWYVEGEKARTHLLMEEYDYPNGYVVLVYKFPAEYMEDYREFLEGAYSKFSEKYKSQFPMIREGKTSKGIPFKEPSFYAHIFKRSDKMRDYWEMKLDVILDPRSEYWDKPDKEKETLHIQDYEHN